LLVRDKFVEVKASSGKHRVDCLIEFSAAGLTIDVDHELVIHSGIHIVSEERPIGDETMGFPSELFSKFLLVRFEAWFPSINPMVTFVVRNMVGDIIPGLPSLTVGYASVKCSRLSIVD